MCAGGRDKTRKRDFSFLNPEAIISSFISASIAHIAHTSHGRVESSRNASNGRVTQGKKKREEEERKSRMKKKKRNLG